MNPLTSPKAVPASSPQNGWVLLAIVLAGFGLRVYRLGDQGFWFDEAFSHLIASLGLYDILEYARMPFEHPPLYYYLVKGWMGLTGDSEFAMRFLSLLFSVLSLALLYRFACRWFSTELARWAIILAALSPFGVVYAQEARMYIVVLCVSIIALDNFLRWLARGQRHAWLIYVVLTLLSFGLHYYSALLLLVENFYVPLFVWCGARAARTGSRKWTRLVLTQWVAANVLIALLLGGWLMLSPGARESLAERVSHPLFEGRTPGEIRRNLVFLVLGGIVFRPLSSPELAVTAFLLLVATVGAVCVLRAPQKNPHAVLLVLLAIVPPMAAALVPLNYNARYLFMVVPALILLSAAALLWLQARRRLLLGVALLAVLGANGYGLILNYGIVKNAYRDMASIVTRAAQPDDALIFDGPRQEILAAYYLRGPWVRSHLPKDAETAELSDIHPALAELERSHPRLWLIAQQSSAVDPANNGERWLSLNAYPVSKLWFQNDDFVALFLSAPARASATVWEVAFGEWLLLEQSSVTTQPVAPGDGLAVALQWHALKAIPQPQQLLVTLRLLDAQGRIVQERVIKPCNGFCPIDDWVVGETVADRHGLLVPRDAPTGEYSLRLEVYAPRQQRSLPITGAQSELGASLELARVHVTSDK